MEGKDNRSRDKRHKMKQLKQQYHRKAGTTSSSSVNDANVSGIVDIVDSSDERFVGRGGWKSSIQPQTKPRDMLINDSELDELESAQMNAGDFKLMSQLPTSIGGYFQFSSEKQWDSTENGQGFDRTEASEYFTLNLKLLNAGLKTISFYKRMDYPASMFTKEELAAMNKAAEIAEKTYTNVLKEHESNPNPKIKINSASGSAKSRTLSNIGSISGSVAGGGVEETVANSTTPDELDELLNVTTEQVAKIGLSAGTEESVTAISAAPSTAGSVVENKNDIQEWLDNVLEE